MSLVDLISAFPLLVAQVDDKRKALKLDGYLQIMGCDHEVNLLVPEFPSHKGLSLSTDVTLSMILEKKMDLLLQASNDSSSLLEYLQKLKQICEDIAEDSKFSEKTWTSKSPSYEQRQTDIGFSNLQENMLVQLLSHIDLVGWSMVTKVSSNFTSLTLETKDRKNRVHHLQITIPLDYPSEAPSVKANLPLPLNFNWNSNAGLHTVVSAWEEQLTTLQQFWDVLDELDEMALILDPPLPERKHTSRRILLRNHVSVQLNVSPVYPTSFPQCHLLGSTHLTSPMITLLTSKYQEWNPDQNIVDNLQKILNVDVVPALTTAVTTGIEDWSAECAVCYSLHLEGYLPDLTCDHCSQSFHIQCLYDWLRCLPNSRQSMNFIFGECPYCTKAISCKVPT